MSKAWFVAFVTATLALIRSLRPTSWVNDPDVRELMTEAEHEVGFTPPSE